jgi:beta-mannosidase
MEELFQHPFFNSTSIVGAAMKSLPHFQSSVLALLGTAVTAQKVVDLSTAQWIVSNPVYNISVPGSVPSQVHLDLYREGIIPDPYFGLGDFDLRWVTYENWTYEAPLTEL